MSHKFQINLRGIIDLLSNHLYSGPQVYLRELLQNGVDAIRAREHGERGLDGTIVMEVIGGSPPTLMFADNGIGLSEDEIHHFLATIGESSKRDDLLARRGDFLGQFGIGLLSGFLVSDEIVVITRSSREDEKAVEWRGRPDGTYTVKVLDRTIEPGTQVYLRARPGCEKYLDRDRVEALARHYGGLLPYPITLKSGDASTRINDTPPPWREAHADTASLQAALLEFGRETFGDAFFDAIPLASRRGRLDGVAYVLPHRPSLAAQGTHRVYLKNMLLSESAKNLVPEWAFFVKCLVNADDLRPTASRESLYEDEALGDAREALGECLRAYLVDLSKNHPQRWARFLVLHFLSIKALALQDDELFRLFIDWLPFETSLGEMTLAQVRRDHEEIRYVSKVDAFRQIAQVAAAQGMCVVNGGYTYNVDLLERYAEVFSEHTVRRIEPSDMAQQFSDLPGREREELCRFLSLADAVLEPFGCAAEIKRFEPAELPTLYTADPEAVFRRSLRQSQGLSRGVWSDVLGDLDGAAKTNLAQLCFNLANPLVRKISLQTEPALLRRAVQMLYVQALLMGHHPLSDREMKLLNDGLLGLIEWGLTK